MTNQSARRKQRTASTENSGSNSDRGKPENLTPWPKGVSRNPGGRPKRTPLTDACRELLDTAVPGDRLGRTYAVKVAEMLARKAIKGEIRAAQELADRAEGRPRQSILVDRDQMSEIFEGRSRDELDYFAKFSTEEKLWPTPEDREHYKEGALAARSRAQDMSQSLISELFRAEARVPYRRETILMHVLEGQLKGQLWIPGPLFWLWNCTETFDNHWLDKGLDGPYREFPHLPYTPWMFYKFLFGKSTQFWPKSREMLVADRLLSTLQVPCNRNSKTCSRNFRRHSQAR